MTKKKILIIDDEKGFTSMLSLNLESTGHYDVRVANDSSRAMSAALQYNPDLILLDIIMPKIEGTELAIEIQNNEELQRVPIIFLTATLTKEEVETNKGKIGDHPVVAKPSTLNQLIQSIEENLP